MATREAQMTVTFRSAVATLGIVVALFLGFGAVDELLVRGIRGGEIQPLVVGLLGTAVSLLLAMAALALWRQHRSARRMAIIAAVAGISFHAYAALPPHRNAGLLVLLVAAAYTAALLGIALGQRPTRPREDDVRRA